MDLSWAAWLRGASDPCNPIQAIFCDHATAVIDGVQWLEIEYIESSTAFCFGAAWMPKVVE